MSQAGFAPENPIDTAETEAFSPAADADPGFGAAEAASEMFADSADAAPIAMGGETAGGPDFSAEASPIEPDFDPAPESAAPAPEESKEPYYEEAAADVSDLFQETPATFGDEAADSDPDDQYQFIRTLLSRGGSAAAADDYAGAIDAWSRVLLIDPDHEEARDRIEHIRHAKEELDRRLEPMLSDARSAHENGDEATARDFVERVLELSPQHVEAHKLRDALGAAEPSSTEMPELEDELFTDDFSATADFGAEVTATSSTLEGEWRTPTKPKRKLHWHWWAIIGAVGVMVGAFGLWVATSLMPEKAPPEKRIDVVNRVLLEAAELYNKGQVEEAIVLLEQNSADDVFQKRIDHRLDDYRQKVATPVPTPVPEGLAACRALLAEGRWMAAYMRVKDELRKFPNDPGLEQVRLQILETEPEAAVLQKAIADGDFKVAIAICRDLLEKRPDDPEVTDIYERTLFNAGMAELRAFNLPQSESYLKELSERQPDDEEVVRVLEFVETYKSRPVDMQLEIFVGSIPAR
jgi:tetratricopeptide (TPR) repeat protein